MDSDKDSVALTSSARVAVLILMGLPGSGKTTLCRALPHFLGTKYHFVHICYDQVIPFHEEWSQNDNHSSWKDERSKVVQAAEELICNLISDNSPPENEKCIYERETSQFAQKLTPSNNCSCLYIDSGLKNLDMKDLAVNENRVELVDSQSEKVSYSNQNMAYGFSLECSVNSNIGHYTIPTSLSDIVSMCDEISKCALKNELFLLCVDDNFYYRSMRKEWWNLAAKYELPFCIVTLSCDAQECVSRVNHRHNSSTFHNPNVPEDIIYRMDKHMEFPDGNLYAWEKYSIVINSNYIDALAESNTPLSSDEETLILKRYSLVSLNKISQLINNSLLDPAKSLCKEAHYSGSSMTNSIIHMVDLTLRKIVSKSKPTLRSQVNVKRKAILNDLRNGKLIIPVDILEEFEDGYRNKFDEYVATLINL